MPVLEVNAAAFKEQVLQSAQPVVVDFWATWCVPCQKMSPVVEAMAAETPGVKFCKVNTDENIDLALSLKIDGIPALLAFEGGQEIARLEGYRPKELLAEWLEEIGFLG